MSGISIEKLSTSLKSGLAPLLIDVRRRDAYLKDTKTLAGALRRDPEPVSEWGPELPAAAKVVVEGGA
ncbi:MAG: hypothetical protein ACXWC1_24955 [Burkholderiales bacterium]